jgi:hypothetical protein
VNAIPTLLLHVCDEAEQDTPMLRRYVENRDHVLQELAGRHDISTDAANNLVLLTLHFGDLPHVFDAVAQGDDADDDPDEHAAELVRLKIVRKIVVDSMLDELAHEAHALFKVLQEGGAFRELVDMSDETGGNEEGRLVATVCTYLKDNVLDLMRKWFISKRFRVDKCVYEGLVVKALDDRPFNDDVLRGCEADVVALTLIPVCLEMDFAESDVEQRADPGAAKPTRMGCLIKTLAAVASEEGLKRMGVHVFEPHPAIPGALVQGPRHTRFINDTLRADPVYKEGFYAGRLQTWFEKQDDDRFPMLHEDDVSRTAIAFRDGWLDAATGNWCPRDDATEPPLTFHFFDVCAADHRDAATPLWDKLIKTQLYGREWTAGDTETAEELKPFKTFEGLTGRLFVPAGSDNWQLVLLLIGKGNTGKSTAVKVVQFMLPDGSVAVFGSSRKKSCDLQDVVGKRLLVFPDLAKDIEKTLPGDVWRLLASAEKVPVSRNYQATTNEDWVVPMLMAANEFPSYDDEGGRVSRRLAVFVFDTGAQQVDTRLEEKIRTSELPAIVLRCIRAYHVLRGEVGDRDIHDVLPTGVLPSMGDVKIARNPLAKFVAKGDDVYQVKHGADAEMPLYELQEAFADHAQRKNLQGAKWTDHCDVLHLLPGVSVNKVHACKECGKRASKDGCGPHYDIKERAQRQFVIGMRLVHN